MRYKIIEDHNSENLSPIIVTKGTRVRIGERSDINGSWPNWIYCYSEDGCSEGWTPIQIIHIENEFGVVLEDYSAIELDVNKNEIVDGNIELNGWVWCRKINGLEGWLPKEKLLDIDNYNK